MIRLLLTLIVFGGIAVAGLLYFDFIELTPSGQSAAEDAEQALRNAAETAGEVLGNVTDGN